MDDFVKGVKSFIFGGHDKDDSVRTNLENELQAAASADMNGPMGHHGLGKRPRAAEELQPQPNKRSRRPSDDEYKLLGNGNGIVPRDAVAISIPTSDSTMNDQKFIAAKRANGAVRPFKPGSGNSHKAQNTLNHGQPGKVGALGHSNMSAFKPPLKSNTGPRQTKPTVRQSHETNHSLYGDGFATNSPGSISKRRKTRNDATPVELSDDDSVNVLEPGDVREVNGKRVSNDSQKSVVDLGSQSQPSTGFFQMQEQRNVNLHTNPPRARAKRRRSSENKSASVFSRAQNLSSDNARPNSGDTHRSRSIEHLDRPSSHSTSAANRDPKVPNTRKSLVPVIDLDPKFADAESKRIKEDRDVQALNSGISRIHQNPSPVKGQKAIDRKPANRDSGFSSSSPNSTRAQADGSSLRNRFIHDRDAAPQTQQQSRRQGMKATSSNNKPGIPQESPDPLTASTSGPLRKLNEALSSPTAERPPRYQSPSDIKPTRFTTRKKDVARQMRPAETAEQPEDIRDDYEDRIPLTAIYSRGCVLDARNVKNGPQQIDLVWKEEDKYLEVQLNRRPHEIYDSGEVMTISNRDITSYQSCQDETKVVLRGSASENRSNGMIMLEFKNDKAKSACFSLLLCIMNDRLKCLPADSAKMEDIFRIQSTVVQQDAAKYRGKMSAEKKLALQTGAGQVSRRNRVAKEQEEAIQYEQPSDDDKARITVRPRMQGGPSEVLEQATASPYFPDIDLRPTRKSTRQSKPVIERSPTPPPAPERWTATHELEPWHQSVMYPPTGPKRVAVDFQDIERLDEGEFLNDNLIGYALRRIEENMAPEHKSKVHFLNSFFFTALTIKNGRKAFNYDAVKKWTKQKDLFDTPYIVVPINENLHWFVAIICNLPNLARKVVTSGNEDDDDVIETPLASQRTSARPSPIRDPEEIPDSQEAEKVAKPDEEAMQGLTLNDHDKASAPGSDTFEFGEDGKIASGALDSNHESSASVAGRQSGKKSKKRAAPSLRKYPTDKPTIITLDSFGVGHPGQVSTLKKYVEAEAKDKRGMDVSGGDIQGMTAAGIPVQSNYCDCGLYLVGYVAEFAKDPEGFVNKVLSRQLDQNSDFASFDPSAKRAEIRDDLLHLHDEQEAARIAGKKAKKEVKKEKIGTTAVTPQDPAAPTPSDEQSAKQALSPATVAVPIASTEKSNDAGEDGEVELEQAVPKPFVTGEARRARRTDLENVPDQDMSLAGSNTRGDGDDDHDHGEMLDGTVGSGVELPHEYAQQPPRHKVTSPGLDTLGEIFQNGPDAMSSRPLGDAPSAQKPL